MQPKSVDAGRGAAWFSCGWQLFAKQPGLWALIGVVLALLLLVCMSINFGGLVLTLFGPVLGGGLVYAAAECGAGRQLEFAHLWQGFRDQTKFTQLLILGLVLLAASVLSLLIFAVFAGAAFMTLML